MKAAMLSVVPAQTTALDASPIRSARSGSTSEYGVPTAWASGSRAVSMTLPIQSGQSPVAGSRPVFRALL